MRKKIWIFLLVPIFIVLLVTGLFFLRKNAKESMGQGNLFRVMDNEKKNESGFRGMGNFQNRETVSASGVTSIGTINEMFPVDSLTVGLEIEEVYVASGDTVTTETAILKFTDESVASAREELESLLRTADLKYRAGKIEYEQALINAKYEYEETVLSGKYAKTVYEENIANIEENVAKTQEAYDEALAEIVELEAAMGNNTYKAELDAAQAEWDDTYSILVARMEEWDIDWSEVVSGGESSVGSNVGNYGSSMGNSNMMGDFGGNARAISSNDSIRSQYVNGLKDLYKVLEDNREVLTAAEEAYEAYINGNASIELQSLKLSLPELSEAAANAKASYESNLVQAKLTMETTLAEAELAEKNYETDVEKAESDYEALVDAWEDAQNDLAIFEAQIGNGYYYPTEEGTILRVSLRVGRTLTGGSSVFTIRDSEEMTVTVSVDQADISKLKIGDSAIVYTEDAGMCQGVIRSINPVSTSSNRSSITYSVTVELTGNYANLSGNESVSVYFIVGGSDGN